VRLPGHRKKLLRNGAQARAIVTESKAANIVDGGASAFKLALEVQFPDGSKAPMREKVSLTDIGPVMVNVGDILPVRYDPEDRSTVVVDAPAIRAQSDQKRSQIDQAAVERARRELGD
jgi:hypothetical protein